jgi:transcriptional regulator with XRE-family HTH domain
MVGYSIRLLHGNRKASKKRFGVRFGRHCIDSNISVIEVVDKLGVSRQSVYNWFLGKHEPNPAQAAKISQLFSVL